MLMPYYEINDTTKFYDEIYKWSIQENIVDLEYLYDFVLEMSNSFRFFMKI